MNNFTPAIASDTAALINPHAQLTIQTITFQAVLITHFIASHAIFIESCIADNHNEITDFISVHAPDTICHIASQTVLWKSLIVFQAPFQSHVRSCIQSLIVSYITAQAILTTHDMMSKVDEIMFFIVSQLFLKKSIIVLTIGCKNDQIQFQTSMKIF